MGQYLASTHRQFFGALLPWGMSPGLQGDHFRLTESSTCFAADRHGRPTRIVGGGRANVVAAFSVSVNFRPKFRRPVASRGERPLAAEAYTDPSAVLAGYALRSDHFQVLHGHCPPHDGMLVLKAISLHGPGPRQCARDSTRDSWLHHDARIMHAFIVIITTSARFSAIL